MRRLIRRYRWAAGSFPAPSALSITPNVQFKLGGGQAETITGLNFANNGPFLGVKIGGLDCTSVVVVNPTTITCVTPTFASMTAAKDVLVTNGDGQTSLLPSAYFPVASFSWMRSLVGDYVLDGSSKVLTWTDLSGTGNDFASTGANAGPVIATSIFGSRQAIRFSNGADYLQRTAGFTGAPSASELFIVKRSAAAGQQGLKTIGSSGVQDWEPFGGDSHVYCSYGSTSRKDTGIPSGITFTNGHLYNARSAAGSWANAFNALADNFSTATNAVGFAAVPRWGLNTISGAYNGWIGEVIMTVGLMPGSTERSMVRSKLISDWSIT